MTIQSVPQLLAQRIEATPDGTAFMRKQGQSWQDISWHQYGELVSRVSSSLLALDLKAGTRVCILSETRLEWVTCDSAIMNCGCVTVGVYPSNLPPECAFVINHSDTEVLFLENETQLNKIREIRNELPTVRKIIIFDGPTDATAGILSWNDFLALGETVTDTAVQARRDAIRPDDLASLVYTSGTTGTSKGVMLSHRNLVFTSESTRKALPMEPGWVTLLFLPLAHVFARLFALVSMDVGATVAFAEDAESVPKNMQEVRPHFFAAVPRVYEKFQAKVLAKITAGSILKRALFNRALQIGRQVSEYQQQGTEVPGILRMRHRLYDALVLSKIRDALGGRVVFAISGAAPLNQEIAEFHQACGITILEGIGMTENTSFSNVNRIDANKFGTVGPTGEGIEMRLASDGEVMFRGDNVMLGYYKDPTATANALRDDGWLLSGDIGEIDEDGYLKITDRKKDLIVTAGGKNIAPQRIERIIRTSPFIANILAYGDKRKYVSALITLDAETISEWAVQKGLGVLGLPELAAHPRVHELIRSELDARNEQLASFESVKKFHLLPHDFTIEAGELTPTLKLKRKVVIEKYWDALEALY
jgi:long-chain acyl-CoA synthetase